jgi:ATP-dependent Clp endopeptidase proteolytic subunit ClpP
MYLYSVSNRQLFIENDIGTSEGCISANDIRHALDKLGNGPITVFINSYGGSVDQGLAIYELLQNHRGKVTTKIEGGIAASISSVILLAGEERIITPSGSVMIHDPWTVAVGNADDLDQMAGYLREASKKLIAIYSSRTLMSEPDVIAKMKAETYFSATQAVEFGLCHKVIGIAESKSKFPERERFAAMIKEKKDRQSVRDVARKCEQEASAKYRSLKSAAAADRGLKMEYPNPFPNRTKYALMVASKKIKRNPK